VSVTEVVVVSPAKVNLCLGVGPVRADGFHPLATVYQAIDLCDELTIRDSADGDVLRVEGEDVSEVPADASNLALRAAHLLAAHHGVERAVDIHLRKRIPVSGGLAGGSTDAAAALVGADMLWSTHTPRPVLLEIAAELGSDVPFCLVGGTAVGAGRGELVTAAKTRGTHWWVVLPAKGGLSTPTVYGEFDRLAGREVRDPVIPTGMLAALRDGDPARLGGTLENDLQPAALNLRPDLGGVLDRGLAAGALGALVSGSGPTTLYLCDSKAHAEQVRAALGGGIVARAPVPGARVVDVRRA
jgi:4-diphosphocytidyl-2-C-methyl-D-erythritol kinase